MSEARQFETIDARQLESLRVFHEVARALTSNLDLDAVLRTILRKMEEFFGPEQWSLLIVDEEAQELYCALAAGASDEEWRTIRIPINQGIAGRVAASGQPLVIADIGADPMWSKYAAENPELNLQSIASLPIRHGSRTLGVLQLHNSKLNLLPDSSMAFLRVLCDHSEVTAGTDAEAACAPVTRLRKVLERRPGRRLGPAGYPGGPGRSWRPPSTAFARSWPRRS